MMLGPEEYRIKRGWSFWKSLESASGIADNCSVCLILDPDKFVMLRFKLGEFGDLVYLNEADLFSVPDILCKGPLESASGIADNCSVCVIGDTDKFLMSKLKLDEFGDMEYLNEADFISVPDLVCKDYALARHVRFATALKIEFGAFSDPKLNKGKQVVEEGLDRVSWATSVLGPPKLSFEPWATSVLGPPKLSNFCR